LFHSSINTITFFELKIVIRVLNYALIKTGDYHQSAHAYDIFRTIE